MTAVARAANTTGREPSTLKPNLLIIAATKYYYKQFFPSEPIKYHLLALMSSLVDVAAVDIVDCEALFGCPQDETAIERFKLRVAETLSTYRPDIIGVSAYSSYDYLASVDILRICGRLFPGVTTVVGGYHPTAMPSDYTGLDAPITYVVRGEGELVLRNLVIDGVLPNGPVIDGISAATWSDWPLRYDLYPARSSEVTLALSRGCSYKCAFCVQSNDIQNRYRRLTLDQVIKQIEGASACLPLRRILFIDPFFGVDAAYTNELLNWLRKARPNLSFWAETRVDCRLSEWLKGLDGLAFDLYFGVESLAPDTLRLMQKSRDASRYIDSFHRTVDLCQTHHVRADFNFLMNYPGESPESFRSTMAEIRRALDRHNNIPFCMHCNAYSLFPGNETYQRRWDLNRARGFVFNNDGWWRQRKPEARIRSEHCLASEQMRQAYGDHPGFWKSDFGQAYRTTLRKMAFDSFSFYHSGDVLQSLRRHYPDVASEKHEDDACFQEQRALLRSFRYRMTKALGRYDDQLATACQAIQDSFLKLFNQVVMRLQDEILAEYDRGAAFQELEDRIRSWHTTLDLEAAATVSESGSASLVMRGSHYLIRSNGSVFRCDPSAHVERSAPPEASATA